MQVPLYYISLESWNFPLSNVIINILIINIGVGQEWQNTIPEGLTSIHLELGE